jgi:selenocysteine lyase/cysteine desulfurase
LTKEPTLGWLRSQTPLTGKLVYADTATSGLMYNSLLEWRRQHDEAFYKGGDVWETHTNGLIKETRETIASFFRGDPAGVALTPNFSIGLNFLAESLDPGMHVLLLESDYPSVNWPFESRGFKCTKLPVDERLEDRISGALASGNIDILALSLVQWVNGLKVASSFLAEVKKQYPDLLIIADGTQYCGAFSLDFPKSGIDILGASGYKWMLSGYGNAFFMFDMAVAERLAPKVTGFNASGGNPERQLNLKFPRQLEPGHLDTLNFGSLKYSLGILAGIGTDTIEKHNGEICSRLKGGLTEMGLLEKAVTGRGEHGTIFNIRGDRALFSMLKGKGVACALRGKGIRLSLHLYNSAEDVAAILGLLKTYHKSLPAVK